MHTLSLVKEYDQISLKKTNEYIIHRYNIIEKFERKKNMTSNQV